VTPYGFGGLAGVGSAEMLRGTWERFVRERGYVCAYVALHPIYDGSHCFQTRDIFAMNCVYVLDLTLDWQDLNARLDRNRKRQLREWDTLAPQIITDKDLTAPFVLNTYQEFFARRAAGLACQLSRETVERLLALDNVLVCGAGSTTKLEAAAVIAWTPHIADAVFNVSIPGGEKHSAPLLWFGVHHLKALGVPTLNLGGGIRRGDGVAQFKARFGAQPVPLSCVKQVLRPNLYEALCRDSNVDHEDLDGYFPAYYRATAAAALPHARH
jgi:hypothetical protein